MVTKKTRLLSAIAAVLMLVSMVTGIVLPVSAEMPDMPTMTEYHNSVLAESALTDKEFTVSSLAELELASLYQSTLNSAYTLYFINDIAIPTEGYVAGEASGTTGDANAMSSLQATLDGCYAEGGRATISGIRVTQNWLGTYNYGKRIANLNFDDCHATATGNAGALLFGSNGKTAEKTLENLTFTNCSATKGGKSNNLSLVCGKTNGAAATFRNIRIEGCSLIDHTDNTGGPCNIAFLEASTKYSVTLEDIYLINNTIDIDWMDNSLGIAIGELTQDSADVEFNATNVAIIGTTLNVANEGTYDGSVGAYGMNSTLGALVGGLSGYVKKTDTDGTILPGATIENILVYGNDKGNTAYNSVISGMAVAATGANIPIKATNVSTDLPKLVRDTIYEKQNTGASYKSIYVQELTADSANNTVGVGSVGEAAWNLNKNAASLWTLDANDIPSFGATEETKIVKVAAVNKGAEIGAQYVKYGTEVDVAELTAAYEGECTYEVNEGEIVDGKIAATPANDDLAIIVTIIPNEVDAETVAAVTAAKADIESFLATYAGAIDNFAEKETLVALPEQAAAALELAEGTDVAAATVALNEVMVAYDALTYEVVGDVPYKYNDLERFSAVNTWAIGDETDWRAAVAKEDHDFAGETLTLTADIDMAADGDNAAVLPLCYGNNTTFAGTLDGDDYEFQNILVEAAPEGHKYYVGLVGYNTGIIKNLGIASGNINLNWNLVNLASGTNAMGFGAIAGQSTGKIIKCWNAADVTVVVGEELNYGGKTEAEIIEASDNGVVELERDISVGGIVGRGLSGSLMDGCYNLGTVTGLYHASGLNDWGQKTGEIYNSYNAGELICDDNGYTQLVRYNTTSPGAVINSNVYAVGDRFSATTAAYKVNTVANSNLLPVVASSGELAYLLNTNIEYDTNGTVYYKVEGGKTVYADNADERTFRITFTDTEGNTLYAYANGGTELTIGGETFTVTADKDVTVEETLAHECAKNVYQNSDGQNGYIGSHIFRCDHATEVEGLAAYCTRANDEQVDCASIYAYVEDSADETGAHEATQSCDVCGHSRVRNHKATAVTGEVTTPATVDDEGLMTYSCSTCPYSYTEVIEKVKGFALDTTVDQDAGTAAVDLVLKNNPGVAGMTLNVTFDAANLEIVEVVAGELDFYINEAPFYTENEDGTVTATFSVASGEDVVEDGVVATLNFKIKNDAGEVTFSVIASDAVKADETAVDLEGATGVVSIHKHAYVEVITTPAGCETVGTKTFTCSCNASYTEEIPAIGHDMQETTAAVAPDCENAGATAIFTCANGCGKTEGGEEIAALGHDMKETAAKVDATCEAAGKEAVYTCANGCGKTEGGEEIAALGHDMQETAAAVAPGCETAGATAIYTCANGCGKTEGGEEIAAIGHDMQETTAAVAPDCENAGATAIFTCANGCGKTEGGDEIAALGHDMQETAPAVAPDCENAGATAIYTCANGCGKTEGGDEIAAIGHDMQETTAAVEATCTTAGTTAIYTCANGCGKTEGGDEIAAIGHERIFDEDGNVICANCGKSFIPDGINTINGTAYMYKNGVKVHAEYATWPSLGEVYMIDGRPANNGVQTVGTDKVYIVSRRLAEGIVSVVNENVAAELGVTAGVAYAFEGGKLITGEFTWGTLGKIIVVDGRPAANGVYTIDEEKVYVVSNQIANGIWSVNNEAAAAALNVTAGLAYAFEDGKLITDVYTWGALGEIVVVNGRPAAKGVYTIGGEKVYVVSNQGAYANGIYMITDEAVASALDIETGLAYMFKKGVLVNSDCEQWKNVGYYVIVNGRPTTKLA